nr:hypothetical protein [Propioniciclava sp. MC1595]
MVPALATVENSSRSTLTLLRWSKSALTSVDRLEYGTDTTVCTVL